MLGRVEGGERGQDDGRGLVVEEVDVGQALVGPRDRIRDRLQAWRDSKVTTMLVATTDKQTLRDIADLF